MSDPMVDRAAGVVVTYARANGGVDHSFYIWKVCASAQSLELTPAELEPDVLAAVVMGGQFNVLLGDTWGRVFVAARRLVGLKGDL